MQKSSKVIVTIVAVVLFFILFAVVVGVRSDAGHSTPGFFGFILAIALIGALRAIWKKKKDNNDDTTTLQK